MKIMFRVWTPCLTPSNTYVWQEAGLREGDYIVAVDGQDCKWAKHAEVVRLLKTCSDGGVLSVVTLHSHDTQVGV